MSHGQIRSSTEDRTELLGCSINNDISAIVGDSLTKLSTIDAHRQRRTSVKMKSINAFYSQANENNGIVCFDVDVSKETMLSEHNHIALKLNGIIHAGCPESIYNLNDTRSEIGEILHTDDMTLKEFHLRCKVKKHTGKKEMSKSTGSLLDKVPESKTCMKTLMQMDESDLNEPIISFRRKHLKRCRDRGVMSKARKVPRSDSLSGSVTMENNGSVQCLTHIKEEVMELDNAEYLHENITDGEKHTRGSSVESAHTIASCDSRCEKLTDDMENVPFHPIFQAEQDAIDSVSSIKDGLIVDSQCSWDQPNGALPEMSKSPDRGVLILVGNESSDKTRHHSPLILSKPENGSSQECYISFAGKGYTPDEVPSSIQQEEMELVSTVNKESVMMDTSSEPPENHTIVELQCVETNLAVNDPTSCNTSEVGSHFPSQDAQDIFDGTRENILGRMNQTSTSVTGSCVAQTLLPCQGNESVLAKKASMSGTLSQCLGKESILGTDLDPREMPRHPVEFARMFQLQESGDLLSTSGNNVKVCGNPSETMCQDIIEQTDLQINPVRNICISRVDIAQPEMLSEANLKDDVLDGEIYSHHLKGVCNEASILIGDNKSSILADKYCGEMSEGIWDKDLPSQEVLLTAADICTENEVCSNDSDILPDAKPSGSETESASKIIAEASLDSKECRENGESQCPSRRTYACRITLKELLAAAKGSQELALHSLQAGNNFDMNSSCKNLQVQKGREVSNTGEDIKSTQHPKKLPLNRKVFSPTFKEKLCHALDADEFYESMRYYRNKRRLCFDKGSGSPTIPDDKETEVKLSPEKITAQPKNESNITKGILKSANDLTLKGCTFPLQEGSSTGLCSQDAIKFSQRQMHDIDCVTSKLLATIRSMKIIMEETLNCEEFSSMNLKDAAEKMTAAVEDAAAVEITTQKYKSMMNRDFKRFCKIMRSRESTPAVKPESVSKKQRKISFADEVGGLLCQIRIFEEPSAIGGIANMCVD